MKLAVLLLALVTACKDKPKPAETGSGSGSAEVVSKAEIERTKSIEDDLIGKDPNKLAFETKPLIGMTLPELESTYGKYGLEKTSDRDTLPSSFTIPGGNNFPGVLARETDLDVTFWWAGDKIARFYVPTDVSLRQRVIDALTAVRGPGTPAGSLEENGMIFGKPGGLQTSVFTFVGGGYLRIEVGPYTGQIPE